MFRTLTEARAPRQRSPDRLRSALCFARGTEERPYLATKTRFLAQRRSGPKPRAPRRPAWRTFTMNTSPVSGFA